MLVDIMVSNKVYIWLRDFSFGKKRHVLVNPTDVLVFVHDNKNNRHGQHLVSIIGGKSSKTLNFGERWTFSCSTLVSGKSYRVTDPNYSFMGISIIIIDSTSYLLPRSLIQATSKKAEQYNRYFDSFVYAAANNQITIVQRRLVQSQTEKIGTGTDLHVTFDPNVFDSDGMHALGAAARGGHSEIVELLLNAGADINQCTKDGDAETALHLGAKWGKHQALRTLFDWRGAPNSVGIVERANPHALNDLNRTPLHLAALNGHVESVAVLLSLGAQDPHMADYSGKTPLDIAADYGRSRLEIGEALIAYCNQVWAADVCVVLSTFGFSRPQFSAEAAAQPSSLHSPPFQPKYLRSIGWDTLGYIAEFICAPPREAMAAISVVRRRTGGRARELSDGRDRFDIFLGQNIENDPRTRSLPYLLRQDRERLMQQRIINTNKEGAEETSNINQAPRCKISSHLVG